MKLTSSHSTPPFSAGPPPKRPSRSSRLGRQLRSRLFSARTAWWILLVIVATFSIAIFRMFRQMVEAQLQIQ